MLKTETENRFKWDIFLQSLSFFNFMQDNSIAKELGIISDASEAITGAEPDDISDDQICEFVKKFGVYARVLLHADGLRSVATTAVLEIPFLANAFGFEMISWTEYAVTIALAFLVIPIVELVKLVQRAIAKR